MKTLGKEEMQNLSFPDFEVEKFEFLPKDKKLKISVEGAWLDIDGGGFVLEIQIQKIRN